MNNLGNFIVIYSIACIAITAIVLVVPPLRRGYFKLYARLEAEAIEIFFPVLEKIFEKLDE